MTNSRDIGLPGVGAGKGSAPRTKLDANYRHNFEAIFWFGGDSVAREPDYKKVAPGRYRKTFK